MFERFTERARQVVVLAQESARKANNGYIEPVHVLLGITKEEEGHGARSLGHLGITKHTIYPYIPLQSTTVSGPIPFTPSAKKGFEYAVREALSLGHNYIGTEHLLLGLIRVEQQPGEVSLETIFSRKEVTVEQIRNEVIRLLNSSGRRTANATATSIITEHAVRPLPLHVAADHALACAGELLNWLDQKIADWKSNNKETT